MTVKRKNDLEKIHVYIKKLQEIKSFLELAHYEESGAPKVPLRVNKYWGSAQ